MVDVLANLLRSRVPNNVSNNPRRDDSEFYVPSSSSYSSTAATAGRDMCSKSPTARGRSISCEEPELLPEIDGMQETYAMRRASSCQDPLPGGQEEPGNGLPRGDEVRIQARFTTDSTITLIYGPPKRGKSYLLKQMYNNPPMLAKNRSAIQSVVVFTPSRDDWAGVKGVCLREYSPANLAILMKYQSRPAPGHMVIILDDLLARIDFGSKLISELFTRHRHYNISVILAAQNITRSIHPVIRQQVKRFIMFDPPSLESCKVLHAAFGSAWENHKKMYDYCKSLNMSESFSYLIIDVTSGEVNIGSG